MPRTRTIVAALAVIAGTATGQQTPPPSPVPVGASGEQLYRAACVSCHGEDGKGQPQTRVGFADPLPDFTDCMFSSGEAKQDWEGIIHEGGRVRALSHRMPRFGVALSDEQIARVVTFVKAFCTNSKWPQGELNLPRAMATEKAFPENETILTGSAVTRTGARAATAELILERRFGVRNQLELVIPMSTYQRPAPAAGWFAPHLGDVAVAWKRVLYHSASRSHMLSLNSELILPTGNEGLGFGGGTTVFEPALLGAQILPFEAFLQVQAGVEAPLRRDKGDREGLFRAALGRTLGNPYGRAYTPLLEVAGARALESGAVAEWDLIPQMQVTLSKRQHVAFSAGLRLPLNERAMRPREFVMYLLWDWFDGKLFDGWR